MSILQAIILGIVQGITEFLPISSSGHLILAETALDLKVADLADFDVTVHVGTLIAILIYFHKDIGVLFKALWKRDWQSPAGKMIGYLLIGTIPVVCVGVLWGDFIMSYFRNQLLVGIMMLLVAAYFLITEYVAPRMKHGKHYVWWKALLIGCAQCLALIPGISRSGSTIATAMLVGFERTEAARFSFLMGSIAIAGAGILLGADFVTGAEPLILAPSVLMVGFIFSGLASYVTITFLMRFLKNNSLRAFAYYLIVVGILAIILSL